MTNSDWSRSDFNLNIQLGGFIYVHIHNGSRPSDPHKFDNYTLRFVNPLTGYLLLYLSNCSIVPFVKINPYYNAPKPVNSLNE